MDPEPFQARAMSEWQELGSQNRRDVPSSWVGVFFGLPRFGAPGGLGPSFWPLGRPRFVPGSIIRVPEH
jgi:hypothetical protein